MDRIYGPALKRVHNVKIIGKTFVRPIFMATNETIVVSAHGFSPRPLRLENGLRSTHMKAVVLANNRSALPLRPKLLRSDIEISLTIID